MSLAIALILLSPQAGQYIPMPIGESESPIVTRTVIAECKTGTGLIEYRVRHATRSNVVTRLEWKGVPIGLADMAALNSLPSVKAAQSIDVFRCLESGAELKDGIALTVQYYDSSLPNSKIKAQEIRYIDGRLVI